MAAFERRRLEGSSPLYSRRGLLFLNACFVISGATGLIYEVIWSRMLGLVFGATTFAVSAVIAAFMGGLATGSGVGGRLGHKLSRPLRTYGYIELGVALYALCVPSLFRVVDGLYATLWTTFRPGFIAFNLLRFILSCFVLLVPTALMGATLPVLSSALVRSGDNEPAGIPKLYTCNLVGAILGTVATGFVLLPVLGVSQSILVAATLNGMIGVGSIFADRHFAAANCAKIEEPNITSTQRENEELATEASASRELRETKFWLFVAGVSGFVTISAQVTWTRLLTMIIGSSTYAFSLVVALFLLGLSTGAYLVTRRRTGTDYRRVLLYVEIATAISLVFSLFVANQTPAFLINAGLSHNISSWSGLMLLQILSTVMLVLLPATLMGMVMPLVLDWAGNPAYGVTSVRLVGGSYAVNTLGAIWGAWSTAFVLIPVLSTRSAILICATLCVIAALFSYVPNGEGTDTELRRSLAAGIAAAVIIGFFFLAPSMNKLDLSLGAYDTLIRVLSRSQFAGLEEEARERGDGEHRLLMYEEGPTATVSVRRDWDIISMAVNGRTNASDKGDMPTQVMLSQLPLLTAPRIDNALVIGFGSGVSVGSILQSPINSVECVELEPTAIDAGKYFEHVNNRPLADRRLKLIIDDARAYLRVTPIRYDIIVSEPSHPWVPGVANLFTRDFFELGLSRLREDGVFVQWVQIYQLSTESLRSVLATYQSVFPHVLVFRVGGAGNGKDLILVGSRSLLDRSRIRSRLEDQRISAEVARVDLGSADEVESWYVCDEAELRPAVQSAPINTDDNMLIETRVPKEAFKPVMESNAEWINRLAAAARNRGAALQAATR